MQFREIQFWGDSILKGVVFDEARGRYVLLKENAVKLLAGRVRTPLVNRSQMGRTAPQALEVMEKSDERFDEALVVLEFGGNDCDFNWAEVADDPESAHICHTPDARFTQTLTALVKLVREKGGFPVLTTIPPLDPHRYLGWITRNGLSRENILKFIGQPERIYRWQEYYSSLALRMASALGCACLPIREAFLETVRGEDVLCRDGIHPNAQGHLIIADAAADVLGCLSPV